MPHQRKPQSLQSQQQEERRRQRERYKDRTTETNVPYFWNIIFLGIVCSSNFATSFSPLLNRGAYCSKKFKFASPSNLCMQSLSSSQPEEEEDLLKWEKMYEAGEKKDKTKIMSDYSTSSIQNNDIEQQQQEEHSEVKVITFDLDNTLWKTSSVISSANDVLAQYLTDQNILYEKRVEKVMGDLFAKEKMKYSPKVEKEEDIKGPTLLTQLRIDAIYTILKKHNSDKFEFEEEREDSEAYQFALDAFDVWTKARHDAIPNHIASSLKSCLDEIKSLTYTSECKTKQHPVVIGAITDGNSDPRNVPLLKPYFDFVVNAEGIGVSKPDRRLYEAAIEHVSKHHFEGDGRLMVEDGVGPWWVHVGDDFLKDVVAAKDLRMRTVWSRELIKKKEEPSNDVNIGSDTITSSTRNNEEKQVESKKEKSVADLVQELSQKSVINMYIGADDFLADSIERDFADSIVDEFHHVGSVVSQWHAEGQKQQQRQGLSFVEGMGNNEKEEVEELNGSNGDVLGSMSKEDAAAIAEVLSVVVPDEVSTVKEETLPTATTAVPPDSSTCSTKFCVYCGTKLPFVAKFCSSCGEKQPELS